MDKENSLNPAARVVLVVSTGRTGTKALAQHLNACYPHVCALHEPPPTRFYLRRTANRYLCGRLSREELVSILTRCRARMAGPQERHTIYVESNPGLSGFLDAIPDVFPDFQVLHVVRDPRTYIASAINWGVFNGVKGMLARYLPFWLPKPEYTHPRGAAGAPTWKAMSPAERLAWHWRLINVHLDRGAALYGDRYLRVRFEDLFARDGSGLAEVVRWMGLPPSDRLSLEANAENVNASRSASPTRWRDWSESDRQGVLRHCAPLMRAYGYDLSAEGQVPPLAQEISAPATLPNVA